MPEFAAEVLFLDPTEVPQAVATLAAVGCSYSNGPTEFGMVVGQTELSLDELGGWLNGMSIRSAATPSSGIMVLRGSNKNNGEKNDTNNHTRLHSDPRNAETDGTRSAYRRRGGAQYHPAKGNQRHLRVHG
jgi:hypothetical protein